MNECEDVHACGPGAICTNVAGGKQCTCPPGYEGDAYTIGCHDADECARTPCGRNALCTNLEGTFRCACPPGFIGDPSTACEGQFSFLKHLTMTMYIVTMLILYYNHTVLLFIIHSGIHIFNNANLIIM